MKTKIIIAIIVILAFGGMYSTFTTPPPPVTIVNPDSAHTLVTGLTTPGDYVFQLEVTDDKGAKGYDTVKITIRPPMPLPVRLVNFEGSPDAYVNYLHWIVNFENLKIYVVEMSENGTDFKYLSTIQALGLSDYHYDHSDPPLLCYYRLKMIDDNGSFRYSNVVSVKRRPMNASLVILTNPLENSFLSFDVNVKAPGRIEIDILDMSGRRLGYYINPVHPGKNNFFYNLTSYSSGVYILVIKTPDGKLVKKFIKP